MPTVGTIQELWRYPVKSMGGQRVDSVGLDARGVHADRLWAVRDLTLGATATARRLPLLLRCSARFAEEPSQTAGPGEATPVIVTMPDGTELAGGDPRLDAALSDLVGKPVELRPLPPVTDRAAYRIPMQGPADLRRQFDLAPDEDLPDITKIPVRRLVELARYATPVGTYADVYPLHVLTDASLRAMAEQAPDADFDVRRFRPSMFIRTGGPASLVEHSWCGGELHAGGAQIRPAVPTLRCSVPVREQIGLAADKAVVRTISAHADRHLGVYAEVARGGRVAVGDEVTYVPGAGDGVVDRSLRRVRDGARRSVLGAASAITRRR